tara:strand:+ start:7 stop:771 length:765 start_codon:yes stop_codon:yes gene_type:complete
MKEPTYFQAFLNFYFFNIFNISKKDSRKAYWGSLVFTFIFLLILSIAMDEDTYFIFIELFILYFFVAQFTGICRRMNDAGYKKINILWILTYFGGLYVLYILIMPSKIVSQKLSIEEESEEKTDENAEDILRINLRKYRTEKSRTLDTQAYVIFNNETLEELVQFKPSSLEELSEIKGFGEKRVSQHGLEVLEIIYKYWNYDDSLIKDEKNQVQDEKNQVQDEKKPVEEDLDKNETKKNNKNSPTRIEEWLKDI